MISIFLVAIGKRGRSAIVVKEINENSLHQQHRQMEKCDSQKTPNKRQKKEKD